MSSERERFEAETGIVAIDPVTELCGKSYYTWLEQRIAALSQQAAPAQGDIESNNIDHYCINPECADRENCGGCNAFIGRHLSAVAAPVVERLANGFLAIKPAPVVDGAGQSGPCSIREGCKDYIWECDYGTRATCPRKPAAPGTKGGEK